MPRRRWVGVCLAGGVLCLAATTGGCAAAQHRKVALEGAEIARDRATAVEVRSGSGNVSIRVDSTISEPRVRAYFSAHRIDSIRARRQAYRAIAVMARAEERDGRPVLRVWTDVPSGAPQDVSVDLVIRIPASAGLDVRAGTGRVRAVGVDGPIVVMNGEGGGAGGPIEIRTNRPVTSRVDVSTPSGQVDVYLGTGSAGRLDVASADSYVRLDVQSGILREAAAARNRCTGVLNAGTGEITVRSGSGPVTVRVIPDGEQSVPPRL
jgi:hypothetical protein